MIKIIFLLIIFACNPAHAVFSVTYTTKGGFASGSREDTCRAAIAAFRDPTIYFGKTEGGCYYQQKNAASTTYFFYAPIDTIISDAQETDDPSKIKYVDPTLPVSGVGAGRGTVNPPLAVPDSTPKPTSETTTEPTASNPSPSPYPQSDSTTDAQPTGTGGSITDTDASSAVNNGSPPTGSGSASGSGSAIGGDGTDTSSSTNPSSGSVTGGNAPTNSPLADQCKTNPDSLACHSLGAIPVSDALNKTEHVVKVVSQTFSSSSHCPTGIGFTVYGNQYVLSYQPLCDQLVTLRALFLTLAAFAAAFILADSFRV